MRRRLPISLLALLILFGGQLYVAHAQEPLSVNGPKLMEVVPGVLYIKLKANHRIDFENLSASHTGNFELDQLFARIGVTDIYPFDADAKSYGVSRRHGIDRIYVINFANEGFEPRTIGHEFLNLDVVEGASPRYIFEKCKVPNDPGLNNQYALDKMMVKSAWDISTGNANIIIADIDEGVNYNHEDLAANISKVEGHIGKDMIGNGTPAHFKPDFDPMPGPGASHGTFTTGCFGAVPNNNLGIAGTGYDCKIMIIKIANDSGKLYAGYEGIQYAVEHGAKILNCSWGGYETDPNYIAFMQMYADEVRDTGAILVVAAGNDGLDIDQTQNHFFPAYLKGVLCVGATDFNDKSASFTNFGKAVSVFAPGSGIYSTTFPGNSAYAYEDGTSFSSPLTAGVAGLVWAKHPDWTAKFVMRQIIQTCDAVFPTAQQAKYWGRVNAYSALTKTTVPGIAITDYSVDGVHQGGLNYLDKKYSLTITFKNFMGPSSGSGVSAGVQVHLLPMPGYTVQQGAANLGVMTSLQSIVGAFQFTRDSTDNGAGFQLPLYFGVTYGSATVEGLKYYDTLILNLNITGDGPYIQQGVEDRNLNVFDLGNTFPNPVSGEATIRFELSDRQFAKLSLCDVLGREISILSEGLTDAGSHSVKFNVHTLENGVYIYKLEASDGQIMTKRMVVIH